MMKQDQHNPNDDRFNLNGNDSFDNFLASQLRQAQPYLDDDNFTAQVMGQLPAAHKKLSPWQERLIILIPLVIISSLVLSQFPVMELLISLWTFILGAQLASLLQLGLFTTIAVISGASIWFAKQFEII